MTKAAIHYDLHSGYIHNWLVVGPQHFPVAEGQEDYASLVEAHAGSEPGIPVDPVEPAAMTDGVIEFEETDGPREARWRYLRCQEDHFVDLSPTTGVNAYLRAWAYVELRSSIAQRFTFTLTTTGPADLWVNDEHVHRQIPERHGRLSHSFEVELEEGANAVLVRYDALAPKPSSYVMALHVAPEEGSGADVTVRLPSKLSPLSRRNLFESVFEAAYLKQYVFTRLDKVSVFWPPEDGVAEALKDLKRMTIRVQTPNGKVYSETIRRFKAGEPEQLKPAFKYPNGSLEARLMPTLQEYYEHDMRITRTLPFWGLDNNRYTDAPFDTYAERRSILLVAAARREGSLFSEIAKMAIGWWSRLDVGFIIDAATRVERSQETPYAELLAVLGILYRFDDADEFPEALREPLASAAQGARFPQGEPTGSESQALLAATCQILVGQRYPDHVFASGGKTGRWHREAGEQSALRWMRTRAQAGFSQWNSDLGFEEILAALSYLVDLAETDAVWEMATVMMDKMLFLLATNSYKGVFGATRGRTSTASLLGGYLEATSGVGKLMWGMGVLNSHLGGIVSLALMETYELPVLLQTIAEDLPDVLVSREHHGPLDADEDRGVDLVTYKTPDFMLSAAQDHRAGERGGEEHVWQATLGPGATVFVNHPACASLHDAHRPNFWRGNVVLPRVVQWQDALIALHRLPEDDWMGFTHAYFPIHAFDDYVLRGDWAFAKKGDGYLALTATQGLHLLQSGPTAYRELRSLGRHNAWLCQMGRAALDEDFETFQERVLALPVASEAEGVSWTTLRGDSLEMSWSGPVLVDDEALSLVGKNHIENPYCVAGFPAREMDIQVGDVVMRLSFVEKGTSPSS
ncbi:MAG: hypothetical protein ACP5HS_10065 [Anaerolineae bacterium]